MIYIIIPTYNRSHTLGRAIDSCLVQKGDFKIIIVDDGSIDGTKDIIQSYLMKSPRKIIYHYQKNDGVSSACNSGIRLALIDSINHNNDYVTRLGSDDRLSSDAIEIYDEAICKYPDNKLFFFSMKNQDGDNHSIIKQDESILNYEEYLSGNFIGGPDANDCIQLSCFEDKNNFFVEGLHGGDNIPFHKIIRSQNQCIVINKITYIAYLDTISMTRSKISTKYCRQLLNVQLKILELFYDDYLKYNKKLIGLHSLIVSRNYGMLGEKRSALYYLVQGIRYSFSDYLRTGLAIIGLLPFSLYIINYIIDVFITNQLTK